MPQGDLLRMAVRSKTTIFNAALLRTGNSESSDSGLIRAMDANYDEIVRQCFEDGDGAFPFGRARTTLTSRSTGTFGYDDAYVMPSAVVHVIEVYLNEVSCSNLLEPWEIDGSIPALLVNAGSRTVELEYVREGLEHTWSAGFALAVQRRLEAVIKDVEEEFEESSAKDQDADFHLMKASVKGSKNRSTRRVWRRGGGRLVRARRGQS